MTRFGARALLTAFLAILAALLGGCGSATKTVSVSGAPTPAQTSTTQSTSTAPAHTTTTTTPTTTTTTPVPATRTAPEPAFAEKEHSEQGSSGTNAEGLSAAGALLRAHGYTVNEASQYHPDQTLRVLVGTKADSTEGYGQQAFFFVDGRYIGTDTKEPSATVKVLSQSDTEITLGYPLYRNGDPLSHPSGGQATVRFQLNNGQLVALDPIPPANSTTGPSRQ